MPEADGGACGSGRLAHNIVHFARVLRAAGLPVGPGRVVEAIQAVEAVGLENRQDFYWTLHSVFVNRHDQRELGAGQDRQGRRGADAERTRGCEDRVDHHRHEGRVEPDLHRQPGDPGIGHGLGDHNRRGGQTGDQVQLQPFHSVTVEPLKHL